MESAASIKIAEEFIELFRLHGSNEYAGEKVTQLEHIYQAAVLAGKQGFDEEVVLAAFLHDIGHICVSAQENIEMGGFGIKDHEAIGAEFLAEKGFSKKLIRLVESHVEAKRYLTWKRHGYYDQLSEASKITLEYQGGKMEEAEALAFEHYPLFHLIIQMRLWDEEAKVEQQPIGNLEKYRDMIVRHLTKQNN